VRLPLGHRIDGEFVCMGCIGPADHRKGGITKRGGSAVDARVGSGQECTRCEKVMPYLATVRLCPDSYHFIIAPVALSTREKIIVLERQEQTLIDGHALLYVEIGTQREVGIRATPSGKVEIWIHDDPYGEGEPTARWEYTPPGAKKEGKA
jgi:hypothetical protein